MKASELITHYDSLFAGRRDVYARVYNKEDGTADYATVNEPLTEELILQHLQGKSAIAVYPLVEGKVKWLGADFDDAKGTATFKEILAEAVTQANKFRDKGLNVYLERSRSGNGVHLWLFLDNWIDAALARKLMLGMVTKTPLLDKVYPVQAFVEDGKYGNHLSLPYYGESVKKSNSMFISNDGEKIEFKDFTTKAQINRSEIVMAMAEDVNIPQLVRVTSGQDFTRPEGLEGALKLISPYGCKFMRYCWINRRTLPEPLWYAAIGQTTCFKYGLDFAHLISRDYPGYNPREVDEKFSHAMSNPPVSYAFIRDQFPQVPLENPDAVFPWQLAQKSLFELVLEGDKHIERIGTFYKDVDRIRRRNQGEERSGNTWGISGMDELSLLRPSELTIVGGHPSMGKSWLLTAGMLGQAQNGVIPIGFSPETAEVPLRDRMIANLAEVELMALRGERNPPLTNSEYARIERAAETLGNLPVYVDYGSQTAEDVLVQTERAILRNRLGFDAPYVMWFDYLQFGYRLPGEDDRERISRMASEFKVIAKVTEHSLVALSQLIRTEEGSEEPAMHWFAGSSGIERNMDTGIIITGPRIQGEFAPRKATAVKQREGRANNIKEFVLNQGFGKWRSLVERSSANIDSLVGDFENVS